MSGLAEALPKDFFLQAKDYNPFAKPRTNPLDSQVNVAGARRRALAELRTLQENLAKAVGNLALADSQGHMGYAIDVVNGVAFDVTAAGAKLAKAYANAENRHDKAVLDAAAPAEMVSQP